MDVVEFIRKLNEANKEADEVITHEPHILVVDPSAYDWDIDDVAFDGEHIVVTLKAR